ncbi:FMN-binding protein [Nakamurella sp. GG22]
MRRIALVVLSTLAALVALFSYPTSTGHSGSTAAEAVSAAKVITQAGTATTTTGQGPDPAPSPSTSQTAAPPTTAGSATTAPTTTAPTTTAPTTTAPTTTAAQSVTVDGAAEMTRYGIVQVQVVLTGGAITDVTALEYPQQDRTDREINSQAIPLLRSQVLAAQSAKIDGVSGATFTSEGYITSLQSALDAAGFQQ